MARGFAAWMLLQGAKHGQGRMNIALSGNTWLP
jgi:hypothetical protein